MDQIVIDYLNDLHGGNEAARLSHFTVFIHNRSVDVTVKDHGPAEGPRRYSVEACWSDIPKDDRHGGTDGWTLGNPEGTLLEALHGAHWWIFRESDD